jgi:hypothetical protein
VGQSVGQSQLGDRLVERRKGPHAELGPRPRGAPVAVDHHARPVPGAVRHPGLRPPVRQAHRDERGAQVVDSDRPAHVAALEERGSSDASCSQARSRPKRRAWSCRPSPSPRFRFPAKGGPGQGTAKPSACGASPALGSGDASLMRAESAVALVFRGRQTRSRARRARLPSGLLSAPPERSDLGEVGRPQGTVRCRGRTGGGSCS